MHGEPTTDFDDALDWFNYAVLDLDPRGNIEVTYRDAKGALIQRLELSPGQAPELLPGGRALRGPAQSRSELEAAARSAPRAEDD